MTPDDLLAFQQVLHTGVTAQLVLDWLTFAFLVFVLYLWRQD